MLAASTMQKTVAGPSCNVFEHAESALVSWVCGRIVCRITWPNAFLDPWHDGLPNQKRPLASGRTRALHSVACASILETTANLRGCGARSPPVNNPQNPLISAFFLWAMLMRAVRRVLKAGPWAAALPATLNRNPPLNPKLCHPRILSKLRRMLTPNSLSQRSLKP